MDDIAEGPPRLEDEIRAYLRSEECRRFLADHHEFDGPTKVLVNTGLLVIAWVLFIGAIKAVLQLSGLW